MIEIEEVIKIYIEYRGNRQGLFTDYGSVFDKYLNYYENELKKCSLFETNDKANTLAIRYKEKKYIIYHTDERAAIWGVVYKYINYQDAINKYLELFRLL